ncbi:MAG: glycosyltransferase family 2 protein [Bacteroidetes bacterium]|nr:MAG: glycosyltransferase family 2 protein [Bacteroidota bacterium]
MYDVAVIIINYNSTDYTLKCIASVVDKTDATISYQVIVVDNNSDLLEYKKIKDNIPKSIEKSNISLHRSNINTGFGGGNMFGAQFANANYLLFLNNDAMLLNDGLSLLKDFMINHPKVGVCTAQNYDENNNFVPSFDHNKGLRRLLFGRGFLERINPKKYPRRRNEYTQPLEVNWVNGAFLFFSKEAFETVGGFDTNIFLYFEEMDICQRLLDKGYITMLVPKVKILHYQGVSIGKSRALNKEGYISFLYVIRKNHGFGKYLLIKWYLLLALLLKPKKWYLLPIIFKSNALSDSLKQKQKIVFYED